MRIERVVESPLKQAMLNFLHERHFNNPMTYTEVMNNGPARPGDEQAALERFAVWNNLEPDPRYLPWLRGYAGEGDVRRQP